MIKLIVFGFLNGTSITFNCGKIYFTTHLYRNFYVEQGAEVLVDDLNRWELP